MAEESSNNVRVKMEGEEVQVEDIVRVKMEGEGVKMEDDENNLLKMKGSKMVEEIMTTNVPSSFAMSKEAVEAMNKCVTMFRISVMTKAVFDCKSQDRICGSDVSRALGCLGFAEILDPSLFDFLNRPRSTHGNELPMLHKNVDGFAKEAGKELEEPDLENMSVGEWLDYVKISLTKKIQDKAARSISDIGAELVMLEFMSLVEEEERIKEEEEERQRKEEEEEEEERQRKEEEEEEERQRKEDEEERKRKEEEERQRKEDEEERKRKEEEEEMAAEKKRKRKRKKEEKKRKRKKKAKKNA